MDIKELKELKNKKLDEADAMVGIAEKETRSLNDTEKADFEAITSEIRSLDEQIKELEAGRASNTDMEVSNMDKETRGLEQYLRNEDGAEKRSLNITTNNGAVIPENVEGSIIEKMEETAPVFAKARKFPSVNGSLKIAKENTTSMAGFVGEGTDVAEQAIDLGEIKLEQKRVGAAMSLSNQLINDSAVDIVNYSVNLLSRRVGKAIEKSILKGDGIEEFKGIAGDTSIEKVTVAKADAITIDVLMDLYTKIHPEFLGNSAFIMSRQFFNSVAKLKDNNGHYYLQNGVINGKPTYTLFEAEVMVSDSLDELEGVPVLFGSIEDAYAIMVKKGFTLQHVKGDTAQALRGSQLLVLDGYMDGAIFNDQAIVKLEVTAV